MHFADFHTHVLHGVDDGPDTLQQSVALARAVREDGCDRLVITPHFNGTRHDFLQQTTLIAARFEELRAELENQEVFFQQVVLGYEVRYFRGISQSEDLPALCMGDSRIILLELDPFLINEATISELQELYFNGYTVVLAHLERYVKCEGYALLCPLWKSGQVIVQISAASCLDGRFRRTAYRLLKLAPNVVLSSDAHSIDKRPPLLKPAFEILRKKLGEQRVEKILQFADDLFRAL